ncbi:hypothetical protein LTR78_006570 [Recurvomyces mirabilis]|uniref:Uncharacterized protein n=1 Tax=Recurvomyces mirabilis TaxID=574656 RepID=A0AAE0WL17_9PEZI|nr:hypothetical protein LTR78_006570 [Recurvomyces mirabilis]KAK5151013.1 hypothetical protein LTS14_009508 [Recurvomyces mirabilis]
MRIKGTLNPFLFYDIPLTDVVGYSLRLAAIPTTPDNVPMIPNPHVADLTINPDPKSPEFGQPSAPLSPTRSWCVVRKDRAQMYPIHVAAVVIYVTEMLDEVKGVAGRVAKGEEVDKEEIAARLLTPKAFSEAFESIRVNCKLEDAERWAVVANPIQANQFGP